MSVRYHSSPDRLEWLDAVRGIAALVVCATHIRAFMFVHFRGGASLSLMGKVFYGVTSLGHQAVIVFFALSGYLVGGGAFRQIITRSWNPGRYMIKRLTRLYVVLVPALFLTLICDSMGKFIAGDAFYNGNFQEILFTGPNLSAPANDSIKVFIGNMFFLNGTFVPVYGSNSPLWSLAYEFWYYVTLPSIFFALLPGVANALRLLIIASFGVFVIIFPMNLVILSLVWLFGVGAYLAKSWTLDGNCFVKHVSLVLVATSFLWISTLVVDLTARDVLLGCGFAALLPCLAALPNVGMRAAVGLSEISFTLYAMHFPILALLWLTVLGHRQMLFSLYSLMVFTMILGILIGISSFLWFLFEGRTDQFRRFITGPCVVFAVSLSSSAKRIFLHR